MTAPTHSLFALFIYYIFRIKSKDALVYLTLGSILPDIDHPQSTIGRVFFFISNPLNERFGHRNITHSLVLWIPVLIVGHHFYQPLFWLGVGACSHLILDSWNLSGVTLFKPLTDRIFVMAGLKYRVKVGSKNELVIMFILVLLVWGSFNLAELGGFRGMVRELIGDYNIAFNEYQKQGTKVCYLEGKLRMNNGVIKEGKWLIIGQGSSYGRLSVYNEKSKKVINIYDDGSFLKAVLRPTNISWNLLNLDKPMEIKEGQAFFRANKRWHLAKAGDYIFGNIIYQGQVKLKAIKY